jgi:hypothetical protein
MISAVPSDSSVHVELDGRMSSTAGRTDETTKVGLTGDMKTSLLWVIRDTIFLRNVHRCPELVCVRKVVTRSSPRFLSVYGTCRVCGEKNFFYITDKTRAKGGGR